MPLLLLLLPLLPPPLLPHCRLEHAVCHSRGDGIAGLDLGGAANHRAARVQDDGVAAFEGPQRADGVEAAAKHGQLCAGDRQSGAQRRGEPEPETGNAVSCGAHPHGWRGTPQARQRVADAQAIQRQPVAQGHRELPPQLVQPLGVLPEHESRVAARQAGGCRPQREPRVIQDTPGCQRQTAFQDLHPAQPVRAVGNDEFCGAGGRRRPHVSHEVGDGEIDLVADACHQRNRAGRNGPGHDLLVEGPQVLEGTATPGQDEHVALGPGSGRLQRTDDVEPGLLALDLHGIHHHGNGRETPAQYVEHVPDRRPAG